MVKWNLVNYHCLYVIPQSKVDTYLTNEIRSIKELQAAFHSRKCNFISVQPSTDESDWRLGQNLPSERPRYVVVGFQTNRSGSQEKKPSVFDHCDLQNITVTLNGLKHPLNGYNLSFAKNSYVMAYRDTSVFCEEFYGMNDIIAQCNISPSDY